MKENFQTYYWYSIAGLPAICGGINMKESNDQDRHRYDDIINLPHHVSAVHAPMPVSVRAAQFSPFAALTGFEETIREPGRLTDSRMELDEDAKNLLDEKLERLKVWDGELPEAAITYFQPDGKKDGGAYITVTGTIKKIDTYNRMLVFEDGERIAIEEIVEIEVL